MLGGENRRPRHGDGPVVQIFSQTARNLRYKDDRDGETADLSHDPATAAVWIACLRQPVYPQEKTYRLHQRQGLG